ncbi:MAG TPA: PipX family protein [Coleofasciculaceae cyanobacterium]
MSLEAYLNHPTFGLLLMICRLENSRELFTTLYAHRLFFLVSLTDTGLRFEPVTRSDARTMVEVRMRLLQRTGDREEYQVVRTAYQRTFQ